MEQPVGAPSQKIEYDRISDQLSINDIMECQQETAHNRKRSRDNAIGCIPIKYHDDIDFEYDSDDREI